MPNKTLTDYSNQFNSDKGSAHSYIPFYESIFRKKRSSTLNILEIGILFGDSLMLWNEYFQNSTIYGIDDFSQPDGQAFHNFKPVNKNHVLKKLGNFPRIKPLVFNSENTSDIETHLMGISFDIIIDDACHTLQNQLNNIQNYLPYLNSNGIYVCEDIDSYEIAQLLKASADRSFKDIETEIIEFNIKTRPDDRLLIINKS